MKYAHPKNTLISAGLALIALLSLSQPSDSKRRPESVAKPEFDRAQFMVMNLNRGKDSTGWYLQESLRANRQLLMHLEKGARQLDQVDRAYAKSRGRPDDKYLNNAGARIAAAKVTANQLVQQLQEAQDELKSSIQQLLLQE